MGFFAAGGCMSSTRNRLVRRRYRRATPIERSTASAESPYPLPSAGPHDPFERRVETGMRPYEASYDVSLGYAGERSILLP
jgi:hypothetical protein